MIAEGGMGGGAEDIYGIYSLCCRGTVSSLFMLVHHSVGGWTCKCVPLCCAGQVIVQPGLCAAARQQQQFVLFCKFVYTIGCVCDSSVMCGVSKMDMYTVGWCLILCHL
jgi:hypothetical protein